MSDKIKIDERFEIEHSKLFTDISSAIEYLMKVRHNHRDKELSLEFTPIEYDGSNHVFTYTRTETNLEYNNRTRAEKKLIADKLKERIAEDKRRDIKAEIKKLEKKLTRLR